MSSPALVVGDVGVGERPWTVQEIADYLSCSREHARKLIEERQLPAFDIGLGKKQHEYRAYPEDVEAWARRQMLREVEG